MNKDSIVEFNKPRCAARTGDGKRDGKSRIIILRIAAFALLLLLLCTGASATEMIDRTDNQSEYGHVVAAMAAGTALRGQKKAGFVTVVLKTDGCETDLNGSAAVCIAGPGCRYTLLFDSEEKADAEVQKLRENSHIIYAERDGEIAACDTAVLEEAAFISYGAEQMGFQALRSCALHKGGSARAAVIDSGVGQHPLLSGRIQSGWDYVDQDEDPTNDGYGHGTHVAGILADCTQGLDIQIYAIRVLDNSGKGNTSNAANAILEAAEKGIPVINLSFVTTTESALLDDVCMSAADAGCTIVVAAGNNGTDTANVWPAHLVRKGIIVVGAADSNGSRAGYSNYGSSVDVYAYGSGISSCAPGGGYAVKSGTSQAAPHIAAACAMIRLLYGGTPESDENRIRAWVPEGGLIPGMEAGVPARISCHLAGVTLGLGESLQLPIQALPLSCGQRINWSSSDTGIITIDEEGRMYATGCGNAQLIRNCLNFQEVRINVTVRAEPSGILKLPDALTLLESEALRNTGASYVEAGGNLTAIEENALDEGTVLLCKEESPASVYAEEAGLFYISN